MSIYLSKAWTFCGYKRMNPSPVHHPPLRWLIWRYTWSQVRWSRRWIGKLFTHHHANKIYCTFSPWKGGSLSMHTTRKVKNCGCKGRTLSEKLQKLLGGSSRLPPTPPPSYTRLSALKVDWLLFTSLPHVHAYTHVATNPWEEMQFYAMPRANEYTFNISLYMHTLCIRVVHSTCIL